MSAAQTSTRISPIMEAWQRRQAAYTLYNTLPYSENDSDYTPEEKEQWAIIDATEKVIRETVARTPAEVSVQLWTSLQHTFTNREEDEAACFGDLAFFEARDEDLDWTVRLIIAALRSLKAMETA